MPYWQMDEEGGDNVQLVENYGRDALGFLLSNRKGKRKKQVKVIECTWHVTYSIYCTCRAMRLYVAYRCGRPPASREMEWQQGRRSEESIGFHLHFDSFFPNCESLSLYFWVLASLLCLLSAPSRARVRL